MPNIILIDKTGSVKEQNVKDCSEDELYKKAKFKSGEDFKCHTTWNLTINEKQYHISLYGKLTGRAGQENKYEFPPPVDKHLFFGTCLLLNRSSSDSTIFENLSEKEWAKIYEHLYGGFEDIGSEDSEEEPEEKDEYANIPTTRAGYAKDGFVVDDSDSCDEEYCPPPPKAAKKPRKKPASKKTATPKEESLEDIIQNELICSNELEEEEYV
jgi:hypothetical protein